MPIKFHCDHCGKLLTTSDDKAGARAKCPGCSELVVVPSNDSPTDSPAAPGWSDAPPSPTAPIGDSADPKWAASVNQRDDGQANQEPADWEVHDQPTEKQTEPRSDPAAGSSKGRRRQGASDDSERRPCPMCGEQIPSKAVRCRYCGEVLDSDALNDNDGEFWPTTVEAGDVISRGWKVFMKCAGPAIGYTCITALAPALIFGGVFFGIVGLMGPNLSDDEAALLFMPLSVVYMVVVLFLLLGQVRIMLKLTRGEPTGFAELFANGRQFLPALGASILFLMMYTIGFVFCVIPGLFAVLIFWPYIFLIVDRDLGAIDSLSKARELTSKTLGPIFLVLLCCYGITFLGSLACYVGVIVAGPLAWVIVTVLYLRLTNQRTMRVPK